MPGATAPRLTGKTGHLTHHTERFSRWFRHHADDLGFHGETMAKGRLSKFQQSKLDAAFARADRESALKKQGGKCIYCLDPLTVKQVTREHIKPRSAGGLDSKDNIAAACAPCNRLKGSTPYGKFMRLISEPRSGEPIKYRLVWFSRQLNKRIALMEKRVMRAVGRKE